MSGPIARLVHHENLPRYLAGERVYPLNCEVALTTLCDADCPTCFYLGEMKAETMPLEMVMKLVSELASMGCAVTWTGGGEPTLHPNFARIAVRAFDQGVKQGLFTNALHAPAYDPTHFEWVRVTVAKGKSINMASLEWLRRCKRVGLVVNYTEGDEKEIERALKACDLVGLDYVSVRPALKPHGQFGGYRPPILYYHPKIDYQDYKFEDARKAKFYQQCRAYHFCPFIWPNGDVSQCGYMRDVDDSVYVLGNLESSDLTSIMLQAPRETPVHPECQVCCKLHEDNKLIDEALKVNNPEFV